MYTEQGIVIEAMGNLKLLFLTKEFNKYIFENNVEAEMCLIFDIPYELKIPPKMYVFNSVKHMFNNLPYKNRRVLVDVSRKWNENQAISLRHSTYSVGGSGHTVVNTRLTIAIESFFDEVDEVSLKYDMDNDVFIRELMQSVMEYFLFKYNESLGGNRYIDPTSYDCSQIAFLYCKNDLRKWSNKEQVRGLLSPNSFVSVNYEEDSIEQNLNNKFNMWKLYFNKSKYSYSVYSYTDSIIFAAISIETYFNNIVKNNTPSNKHTYYFGKGSKYNTTIKIAKLLYDDNYLNTSLSKKELVELMKKILDPRNKIMHGSLENPLGQKEVAKEVNNALIDFYIKIENKKK